MENKAKKTMECFAEYVKSLPWDPKESDELNRLISQMKIFVGANEKTMNAWFAGKSKPIGLTLLRLRYFLEQQGYRVVELETLPLATRQLGRLIATNLFRAEDVYQEIGFDKARRLVSLLLGDINTSARRYGVIEQIAARHKEDLDLLVSNIRPVAPSAPETEEEAKTESASQGSAPSLQQLEEELILLLRSLKSTISLLSPRLDRMLSGEVLREQRRSFRDNAGQGLVFDLSNEAYHALGLLKALCSEKAREAYFQQIQIQKKGER